MTNRSVTLCNYRMISGPEPLDKRLAHSAALRIGPAAAMRGRVSYRNLLSSGSLLQSPTTVPPQFRQGRKVLKIIAISETGCSTIILELVPELHPWP
jgi:hypothetical protein